MSIYHDLVKEKLCKHGLTFEDLINLHERYNEESMVEAHMAEYWPQEYKIWFEDKKDINYEGED